MMVPGGYSIATSSSRFATPKGPCTQVEYTPIYLDREYCKAKACTVWAHGPLYPIKPLRGSKYPNSRVLGPKVHTLNGFWTLKPYYLGTWTLSGKVDPMN